MELTESRIANLENLKKAGTVVLGIKDSQKDIFSKEYRQALTAIHHIVQESKLEAKRYTSKQKKGWMDPCVDPCADPETYQNITLHRIHTMVSFIGGRGTGKTSAMLTVLRQLQTLRCSKELEASLQPLASITFICLEPIDTGILQSGEDIIAIVLARMFNYLQQITNGNNLRARYQEELRSLYREFDKLYQNLCRLRKGGGHFLEGESALRGLQNLASSHSTAREFKDLVSHLLTYIKTLNGGEKDQYLVIALDDIDMYGEDTSQNCYTLLEEIFDYLSFPGIIVLTTYNENLLKRNCSNHLREKFFEGKKSNDCSVPEQKEVKTLVQQFLEKLILEEYRVYMPVLNRIDVSNRVGIGIRLDNTRDPELCDMFEDLKEDIKQDNDLVVPVKQFLLRIIAARTNVYFDSRGKKRHFFEPNSMRDLSVFWRMLETLEPVTSKDGAARETYANNRKKLFSYTMNSFTSEKLEEGEGAYLYRLSQYPLERQERELIDDIKRRCNSPGNRKVIYAFQEGRWQHNYAELLHSLYYATRLQENAISKELIYCILSSFSLVLNQLYFSPDFKNREAFSQFVGLSIAGEWANDMLPKACRDIELRGRVLYSVGSATFLMHIFWDWQINSNAVYELFGFSPDSQQIDVADFSNAKDFVQAFELLWMLFTYPPKEEFWMRLCCATSEPPQQESEEMYTLKALLPNGALQAKEIHFNVLNFVVNCLDVDDYFDRFTKLFTGVVRSFVQEQACGEIEQRKRERASATSGKDMDEGQSKEIPNRASKIFRQMWEKTKKPDSVDWKKMSDEQIVATINNRADDIVQAVMKKADRYSLRKEFNRWAKKDTLALPLQDFDMMYNILKRLANSNYYNRDIPAYVEVDEVFSEVQKLYKSIGTQLKEQDEFYNNGERNRNSLARNYIKCPFYQHFVGNPSEQLKTMFNKIINAMARGQSLINPAQISNISIPDSPV